MNETIVGIHPLSPVKTWQGEAAFAGERIVLLRMMQCNLSCDWMTADGNRALCDSADTWNGKLKGDTWLVDKLVARVVEESHAKLPPAAWEQKGWLASREKAKIVMITGGEPLLRMNNEAFQDMVEKIRAEGLQVHYETNGTMAPNEWFCENTDVVVISPKYQLYPEKYTRELMAKWQNTGVRTIWKFVVGRLADMDELRTWLENMQIKAGAEIWLLPLTRPNASGVYTDMGQAMDVLKSGADEGLRILGYANVKISPRLQIVGRFP